MAEASPEVPVAAPVEPDRRLETRRKWLQRIAMVVAAGAVIWGLYYLLIGRNYESTDNAYVNAEIAQVTPLISATVLEVKVKDTQKVRRGDVLVVLDPARPRIAVADASAQLAEARRRFRQTVATSGALTAAVSARSSDIDQAQAQLAAAQADFDSARVDLSRRERLAESGAVSGEELTNARKAFAGARAALARAQAGVAQARSTRASAEGELAANRALVSGSTEETDPGVLAAKARLDSALLDLQNTVIRAPIDGVVTRRQVQIGERVTVGKPVMIIVPVGKVYVDANFKEVQLRKVQPGQKVELVSDLYGDKIKYHGSVTGLSGGTGSAFSLIPAQNATGNWIKVVQRVPVRIALDPEDVKAHPLRVGLSMRVKIDLKSGPEKSS